MKSRNILCQKKSSVCGGLHYGIGLFLCAIVISVGAYALTVSAPTPSPQSVSTGTNVVFTVSVSGQSGTPSYIWQFSSSPNFPQYVSLSDGVQASGSTVSGSATATLRINNAQPGDSGRYRCIVTDSTGPKNSGPGTLTVTNVEAKLRIMPVDGPTRRTDTNFQMGATSGFSVALVNGAYNLYGPSALFEDAWNKDPSSFGSGLIVLRFGGDNWCTSGKLTCDPTVTPTTTDNRCGDTAGRFWKSTNSSVPSWLYQNTSTGTSSRLQSFPAQGIWPSAAPPPFPPPINGVCQLPATETGIPGWQPVISAAAINAAFPNPNIPLPANCTARQNVNPHSFATGAADAKVVYINGAWYMAFSETINSPTLQNGSYSWLNSPDLFLLGWATSTDGQNWTLRHQLFQTSLDQTNCGGGLLVTQLITDNGYFYMLADEIEGKGLILFRAPIDTTNPDGFDQWQLETQQNSTGPIGWTSVPAGSIIDSSNVNGIQGLSAVPIAPVPAVVQQGALQRVFNSAAANSPSEIVLVASEDTSPTTSILNVWTAPDFGSAFIKQSTIDTSFIYPIGLFGWEFGFTYIPNQTSATPQIVGNEFDFWLIGNTSASPALDPTGALRLTGYRSTATLSGGIYSPRAAFLTSGGDYLAVTAGNVTASQTSTGPTTTFVVLDANVNLVQSGDAVNLQAGNGNYISATNGGGSSAVAVSGQPGTNETFTIVKTIGSGPIKDGDSVAFRSAGGYYLTAQNGGGGAVNFPTTTITPAATFTYKAGPL